MTMEAAFQAVAACPAHLRSFALHLLGLVFAGGGGLAWGGAPAHWGEGVSDTGFLASF